MPMRRSDVSLFQALAASASLAIPLFLASALQPRAAIPTGVAFKPVFASEGKHKFTWPVCLAEIPGGSGSFLVLEKNSGGAATAGKIWKLDPIAGGDWAKTEFLSLPVASENVSNGEIGLLGLAFHPRFRENGRYIVDFNPTPRIHAVEERRVEAATGKDAGEAKRLLTLPANDGHNGGTVAFGPDGMLYVSVGDATDPANGQKRSALNGKILRIDVDKTDPGLPYAIPKDNPFLEAGMKGEIFAFGFRNPWRFSFDPATGALWAGDVGLGTYEEINKVEKGGNYGWDAFEGPVRSGACATAACSDPVLAYGRDKGRSVIGGHVYRADPTSRFYGAYLFGDYQYNGPMYAIMADGAPGPLVRIGELGKAISSLGTDSQGNIYVIGHDDGIVYRLEHAELRPGQAGLAAERGGKDGKQGGGGRSGGPEGRKRIRYVKLDGSRAEPWESGAIRMPDGSATPLPARPPE
jgi:glucose/arabinose dehydrogenase